MVSRLVFHNWSVHGVRDELAAEGVPPHVVSISAEPRSFTVYVELPYRFGRPLYDRLQDPNETKGRSFPEIM